MERTAPSGEAPAVTLRPAGGHDQDAVLALLAEAGLPLGGVAERFPNGYTVAVVGDRLVGVAAVERYERWGLLRSVAVVPDLRSAGLGARLAGDVLAGARGDGLDEIYLLTTTAPAFFGKLGFCQVDRAGVPAPVRASAEFASICPSSAVCMALRLGAAATLAGGPGGSGASPARVPCFENFESRVSRSGG
jgi:amino-acid N-acetyltransferase